MPAWGGSAYWRKNLKLFDILQYLYTPKLELFSKKTFEKSFRSALLSARKLWRSLRPKQKNFLYIFLMSRTQIFFKKEKKIFCFARPPSEESSENSERRKAGLR